MKIKSFIEKLRMNFYKRLDRKTGWGKVELREEFEQALTDTTIDEADEARKQ